jgi:hypothetical protein
MINGFALDMQRNRFWCSTWTIQFAKYGGYKMKQSEAVRIPTLLVVRRPRPVAEEAVIEGIRMTVILGDEVDTVIRHTRVVWREYEN